MSTIDVNKIADWYLNRVDRDAGDAITHLKLQKLLYFAEAWYLANEGEAFSDAEFQAWAHGPVCRPVYDRFKKYGWDALDATATSPDLDKKTSDFLEKVFEIYGKFGAKHLEEITHGHAPWINTRGSLSPEERCETIISKQSMREFYGEKIGKSWKKTKLQN
jgi:uncharacterized phage-associated protein